MELHYMLNWALHVSFNIFKNHNNIIIQSNLGWISLFILFRTGFAFGLLVYSALQVSYDVFFISSYGNYLYDCASYVTLVLNILFPIYSLFTLFFIVKYMNVVINVNQNLARMFLMHIIGTSLSLWVFTIIRETADAIAESDAEHSGTETSIKNFIQFSFNGNVFSDFR